MLDTVKWSQVQSYAYALARKNQWKTQPMYGVDDLLQEAYLIYSKLLRRYLDAATDLKKFLRLFGVSFYNRILQLAASLTRQREVEKEFYDRRPLASSETSELLMTLLVEDAEGVFKVILAKLGIGKDLQRTYTPVLRRYADGTRQTILGWLAQEVGQSEEFLQTLVENLIYGENYENSNEF